jgi:hypothetical protein
MSVATKPLIAVVILGGWCSLLSFNQWLYILEFFPGKVLQPDGSASPELELRVRHGVAQYSALKERHPEAEVMFIVSGAAVSIFHFDAIESDTLAWPAQVQDNPLGNTEARVMRDLAVADGLTAKEVHLEDKVHVCSADTAAVPAVGTCKYVLLSESASLSRI